MVVVVVGGVMQGRVGWQSWWMAELAGQPGSQTSGGRVCQSVQSWQALSTAQHPAALPRLPAPTSSMWYSSSSW